ncbi:MAG TPA: class I poly(R)-hydroxyalkanoic acid synthase [Usitatibacter sp.]|jgi:polyhydroxyalkanoate synthase|nr:class I poly(R)-hydroxyalkanoic acid synthase [Usitatibacter sp.]
MAKTARPRKDDLEARLHAAHEKLAETMQGGGAGGSVMSGFAEAYRAWLQSMSAKPEALAELQARYMQEQMQLWLHTMQPDGDGAAREPVSDKRFAAAEWNELPVFRYLRDSYLLTAKTMMNAVEEAELDRDTKQRMRFFMRQYLDAAAPSNYLLTNPEALKAAIESRGKTLQEGAKNLMADLERGRISMTDETAFEVGVNIAVSKGAVVWENDLIQLIQYAPLTDQVYTRPLLMVPPCINKFYIMDLQPDNSLVRFAVAEGHTVFMVSWRNVKEPLDKLTWDDYLEMGVLAAIEQVQAITKQKTINVLGFCIGGTLVGAALAVLEARRQDPVASLTLLTTLLDFTEVGDIRVYIDENFVGQRETQLCNGGVVPGGELAGAFSSLRANDLVWNYVVNNYLKGQQPPAFDLLYWNADATNLPGPMYAYYLRNTYQDNKLARPNALTMLGEKVSLKRLEMPAFVFSAREDHIVPWKGGYLSALCLGGDTEFVLGASGHIAGTINSAARNRRSYWIGSNGRTPGAPMGPDPDQWLERATEHAGSWWTLWSKWIAKHGGKKIAARKRLGDAAHKPIEPAPGRYVKERA